MTTKTQKKPKAKQVRIRADKAGRVEKITLAEAHRRNEKLSAIDIYDEILEEGLTKRERKLGI